MLAADVLVDFAFQDPAIVESSALVAVDGRFVTTNDSGDTGRVFTVDAAGRTVGVTSWSLPATDVEALAPAGSGEVWVGDIGDNTGSRPSVTVVRVPVGPGDRTVTPPAYSLAYPDGPHDAEALLAAPDGRLLVVTKELFGGRVYAAPERLSASRPNRLEKVTRTMGLVTDGAFFPDGRHYLLRDYGTASVYTYPGHRKVASFRLPVQSQGEGIAVDGRGWVHLSSEGVHSEVVRSVAASVWGWLDGFVARAARLLTGHGAAA